jgi:hypothetical protein
VPGGGRAAAITRGAENGDSPKEPDSSESKTSRSLPLGFCDRGLEVMENVRVSGAPGFQGSTGLAGLRKKSLLVEKRRARVRG